MANTKEIKSRINSVKGTQKITNAMYMISSTKMRKARTELDKTRPYFESLRKEIVNIYRLSGGIDSRLVNPEIDDAISGTDVAVLVITADKGLAGAYNQNVIRRTEILLKRHERDRVRLFVVGEYGRQYFSRHKIPVEQSFLYTAQSPSLGRAREISEHLIKLYMDGIVDRVVIIYTDFSANNDSEAKSYTALPLNRSFIESSRQRVEYLDDEETNYEFYPSATAVLENVVTSYVTGIIYSTLVDSFCSEHNARMTAMDAANRNAEELIGALSVKYNRLRQAQITQEITEISAGAKAQRLKRMKRAQKRLEEAKTP